MKVLKKLVCTWQKTPPAARLDRRASLTTRRRQSTVFPFLRQFAATSRQRPPPESRRGDAPVAPPPFPSQERRRSRAQGSPPADAGARRIHIVGELILYRRCSAARTVVPLPPPYLISLAADRARLMPCFGIPVRRRGWGEKKTSPARGLTDGDGEFAVVCDAGYTRPWPSRSIYHNEDATALISMATMVRPLNHSGPFPQRSRAQVAIGIPLRAQASTEAALSRY